MSQIAYHRFPALASNLTAFHNVSSPSDLIIAYAVLFAIPKPASKPNCGYFTTDASKTYQVGDGCPFPGENKNIPVEIPELKDKDVNHFCMGMRHAAMLLDDGSVWSWGANEVGQLGHGDESATSRPKKVVGDVPFSKIFCAANATIATTQGGDVFQWGQLSPKSTEKWSSPHKCGINGEYVYVGANHAGATKGSKLFTWGLGDNGRLGIGSTKDVSCDKPERVRLPVEDVAMGARSTAVVDQEGRVRVFGRNYGNLKPKQGPSILTPVVVKRLAEVETLVGTWTDDFYLANLEDGDQMIFGDQIPIDDPEADKEGLESKGNPPKKMRSPIRF
uniref:E3 ubiquitin-protein ligase HERC2 n=1 Tax=Lygus hesperus TaxID=30085 RepID=A0A146L8S9_LYGHE